ncbi:porin family protein [Anoxybacter fermentans]|nr:porin family protein [Anoxybacter fermentans]
MKKTTVLFLVGALVLIFGGMVCAKELENIKLIGGITYNTYDYTIHSIEGVADINEELEDLKKGVGFFTGIQYWLNEWVGFEAGFDIAGSSYKDTFDMIEFKLKSKLTGPYGTLVLRLLDILKVNAGIGYYSYNLIESIKTIDFTISETISKGNGFGILLGGQISIPIQNNFSIDGNVGCRLININVEEDNVSINMSGFRFGGGITYHY